MKKQYQISKRRAVESFQKWAAENTTPLQLLFETSEMAELSKASLGDLLRTIGKLSIEKVMDAEVEQLVGRKSMTNKDRQAYRWGTESGYCIVDGQRVPIDRPPVRNRQNDKERRQKGLIRTHALNDEPSFSLKIPI